jgi:hypothetical protein
MVRELETHLDATQSDKAKNQETLTFWKLLDLIHSRQRSVSYTSSMNSGLVAGFITGSTPFSRLTASLVENCDIFAEFPQTCAYAKAYVTFYTAVGLIQKSMSQCLNYRAFDLRRTNL